jgi:hypothetical protein
VKTGKFTSMIAGAALALAPVAATAANPVQSPAARSSAEMTDANSEVGEGTMVFLGLLLVLLFALAVISNNSGGGPNNTPASP